MKKLSFLIVLFCVINSCQSQAQKEIELITNFVKDLFQQSLSPKEIIRDYIEILPNSKNKLSLSKRTKDAEEFVESIRKRNYPENLWLIPNYDLTHIKNPIIYSYSETKSLNTIEISGIDTVENRVYVLLNSEKDKILQYFLLNKDRDKIVSFSLFVKGSTAYFFCF